MWIEVNIKHIFIFFNFNKHFKCTWYSKAAIKYTEYTDRLLFKMCSVVINRIERCFFKYMFKHAHNKTCLMRFSLEIKSYFNFILFSINNLLTPIICWWIGTFWQFFVHKSEQMIANKYGQCEKLGRYKRAWIFFLVRIYAYCI